VPWCATSTRTRLHQGDREERERLLDEARAAGQAGDELPRHPQGGGRPRGPYPQQCQESARLIAEALGWNDARTRVTFQSRFGKAEWLQPYTQQTLKPWAPQDRARGRDLPGFAADCLETLEEISMEVRDAFKAAGGRDFHYIPTTNDTPAFMTALAAIAQENLDAHAARPLDH
jgi:ferrochelatase